MKRKDYSSNWMKNRVAELKKSGVTEFLCNASYVTANGKVKVLAPALKSTAQGISAYANRMYLKYGDTLTVNVSYFDNEFKSHILTTYSA